MNKNTNEWLKHSRKDLSAAKILVQSNASVYPQIAFLAQQSVEKAIKAILCEYRKRIAKTHNIKELLFSLESINQALAIELHSSIILSEYAVEHRYPDAAIRKLTRREVLIALKIAVASQQTIHNFLHNLGNK